MTSDESPSLAELAAEPKFREINGVQVRFVETGVGHADSALLLSPWPESILAYEAIWPQISASMHVVAIDLPGFGRSGHEKALMSPRAMGEFIVRAADAFGLAQPHVVGPDVGTSAALFAAASRPGRFRSLVIGTGATAVPVEVGEPLREWVYAPDLTPYRRIGGRAIVERALQTLERHTPSEVARADYIASYEGDRFAESMRYVQSYPAELPVLRDLLSHVDTPVRIIASIRDTVVPPVNAEFLHDRLPRSDLHLIDAGHFAWEDGADEYAALVRAWWDGDYARTR